MRIAEEFRQRHRDASPAWLTFLEYAQRHPESTQPLDMHELQSPCPVQAWPTFVTAARRREIAAATIDVFSLLRKVPSRLFGMDQAKIAAFYGIPPEVASHILVPPLGLDYSIGRGDFIDSATGFKCVEFNCTGNLGGLECEFIGETYAKSGLFSLFLQENDICVRRDRIVRNLFEHMIRETLKLGHAQNVVNIAAIIDSEEIRYESNCGKYATAYADALARAAPGIEGRVICCGTDEVTSRNGRLFHGEAPLHALWELGASEFCPAKFFPAFKAGRVAYFNSPFVFLLGDKRNLALLSEHADDACFDESERRIIRDHIPWSRVVKDIETVIDGHSQPLLAYIREHRAGLVLKKGFGMGGEQVCIGRSLSTPQWLDCLCIALLEGDWLVQEYVQPRSFLYHHDEQGMLPYHGVWGTFCFGETYGGAFLRITPETCRGPINTAQGAMVALVFEAM
jgi:hypothetical protein